MNDIFWDKIIYINYVFVYVDGNNKVLIGDLNVVGNFVINMIWLGVIGVEMDLSFSYIGYFNLFNKFKK